MVWLCVTMITAGPRSLLMLMSRSMICEAVSPSRLPVGSSARMISGLLSRALAMAILCCSPPDSW